MGDKPEQPSTFNWCYPSRGARATEDNFTPRSRLGSNGSKGVQAQGTVRKCSKLFSYVPQPLIGIVPTGASTPIPSPSRSPPPYSAMVSQTIRDQFIHNEMLGEPGNTPISHSAGVAFISNLPPIPALNDRMSANDLAGLLDILALHIDNYGDNLVNLPNWKKLVHIKYKEYLDFLTSAQNMALNLDHYGVITRCIDLMAKLEENKMKLSLQSAGESSMSSFYGFPSLVQNVSRDTTCIPDNSDQLARISALEQSASQVNCIHNNFPLLAERVASLEVADTQDLPSIIEKLKQASIQLNNNTQLSQNLESKVSSLEVMQQQILHSFDGIRSSTLKFNDSIKLLTHTLAVLQTSVSNEMDIMRQNIEELTKNSRAVNQQSFTVSQAGVPASGKVSHIAVISSPVHLPTSNNLANIPDTSIAANTQQSLSFKPQVFHPPVTTMHCSNAVPYEPIYTTAPITNNSNLLDSNNFSSIPQKFPHTGLVSSNYQGHTPLQHVERPVYGISHRERQPPYVAQPSSHVHIVQGHAPSAQQVKQPGFQSSVYHHSQFQPHVENHHSNASGSSSTESRLSAMNIHEKMLKGQIKGLMGLLSPSPSEVLPKSTILDLHKNRVMAVENQTQNLQRSLRDYIRSDGHCFQLCDKVSNVIDSAISWSSQIRQLYQAKGVHKKSQGGELYDILPKFSPKSEIDIFNFLKRFESSTEEFDYPEERAELLYNKFLCSSIQEEMVKYKADYAQMRKMLLHRYADPKIIMTNLLSTVSKEIVPTSNSDVFTSLSYYRKLQSSLEKMSALLKSQEPFNNDLEVYVTSTEFLHSLLLLVPIDAKGEFFKQMNKCGEDTLHIRGITPFRLIISSVNEFYEFHDHLSRTTSTGRRGYERQGQSRSNHTFVPQDSSESSSQIDSESDNVSDSDQGDTRNSDQGYTTYSSQVNFQKVGKASRRQKKPISKFNFPCILVGHNHELSDCQEFFLKSPRERAELRKTYKFQHCLVCLKSSDACSYNKCGNLASVPKILICKNCKSDSKANKNLRVYSTMFCFRKEHQKPSNPELLAALESYIPDFSSSTLCLNSFEFY